jgi:glycosyltransferase involved in cell wall biosynthesis
MVASSLSVPTAQQKVRRRILLGGAVGLGNRSFMDALERALASIAGIETETFYLDVETYRRYPASRLAKLSYPIEAASAMAQRFKAEVQPRLRDFDAMILNGWETVPAVAHMAGGVPIAATMDTTPFGSHAMRADGATFQQRAWQTGKGAIYSAWFGRGLRHVTLALPMSRWCGDVLEQRYRFPAARVRCVNTPLDLTVWTPATTSAPPGELPYVLFVGNDWHRKGGPLLLESLQRITPACCRLIVASHDPAAVAGCRDVANVEVLSGLARTQLIDLYRGAAALVLPTSHDYSPQVIAEASACGIPVISTALAAIPEMVRHGEGGIVLPPRPRAEAIASAIHELCTDPDKRRRMGERARAWAVQHYALDRFAALLDATIDELVAARRRG